MSLTITENKLALESATTALQKLSHTELGIGIPPEKDVHSGPFSASELLALHEGGSPLNHTPPRPVLEPALSDQKTRDAIAAHLLAAVEKAHTGDLPAAMAAVEQAGETGAQALKAYITSGGNLASNSPKTLSGGWMRNRKSGKPFQVTPKSGALPLLDTGQLVNSFGYKIKE